MRLILEALRYMHHWTASALIQEMASPLLSTKSSSEPMIHYLEPTPLKFKSKYKFFIHENAFENVVCPIVAILSGVGLILIEKSMPIVFIVIN